ncbi:MAG: RNA-binding transcriptional accessory protein [Bacteroidales bacterium]|nr:RNA-binding transcriptional accessory protein [Bacteroidales bacterium]
MNKKHIELIALELHIKEWQVEHTVTLLEDGATIPFVSRYRKEATGSLDEVQVAAIHMLWESYKALDKRKEAIIRSIEEQEKMTSELRTAIENCWQMNRLEDLYLPYKPKRKTRASVARSKGLEPLALAIMENVTEDCLQLAKEYTGEEVASAEEALAGARDIIAEIASEHAELRQQIREVYQKEGTVMAKVQKGKEEEGDKYRNYFDHTETLRTMAPHRLLALLRAHKEGIVSVVLKPRQEQTPQTLAEKTFLRNDRHNAYNQDASHASWHMKEALADAYRRLIHPSIENEVLNEYKDKADRESIKVFQENLRQLLLAPPLGQKRVLAIDPGFRTGCKVVCLSEQGDLLHNDTIYPHPPRNERSQAMRKITQLTEAYKIQVIAVGSGTAGRETEQFLKKIAFPHKVQIYSVNEEGASVYSASKEAREEFPDYDVTVRGAVSIGRRLMDPLAELVKIDPKSLGVGQYQHDVNQTLLKESLDQTVSLCVNHVGVNLNTASQKLLTYVSGLGPRLAQNIVEYRKENGPFPGREALKKVPRLGEKAFEQCAGFLRIPDASNILDNTGVHPERYSLVGQMAKDLEVTVNELVDSELLRKKINLKNYVTEDVGMPTLQDIMAELDKPGRDPRAFIKVWEFDQSISSIEDLKEGMILPGIISNVTHFGAFVNIGIKQDGLIHVSQMGRKYVHNPLDVVKVHEHVMVKVLKVDTERGRIQLRLERD